MYVMKSGMIVGKYNVKTQVDSLIFYKPTTSTSNFEEKKIMLTTDVIDAEYSKAKDILVYVSGTPSKINMYNDSLGTISSIDLVYPPTCVSVSSDGNTAVVGHDGNITYVDLNKKKIIKSYSVSCYALDIVLGNNKWAYVFPKVDQWENLRCVNLNLSNDNEVLQTGMSIYAGTKGKMHPSGNYIYGADNGLSPSDVEKFSIQNGAASYLYDCAYHGDYPFSGDLWFSEDGSRIFTRGKTVLKASTIQGQDMIYNGTITLESNSSNIMWLDHSSIKNNIYLISNDGNWNGTNKPYIYVYNSANLVYKSKYALEKYLVGDKFYEATPYFVFCNSKGTRLLVLTKARGSGLENEWAIQKIVE